MIKYGIKMLKISTINKKISKITLKNIILNNNNIIHGKKTQINIV